MIEKICFQKYALTLRFLDPAELPPFKGDSLRGLLSAGLRKRFCRRNGRGVVSCRDCTDLYSCLCAYFVESPAPPGHPHRGKYPRSPHPFVLLPAQDYREHYLAGDEIDFELTLVGKAINLRQKLIEALDNGCSLGRAGARGRVRVERVRELALPPVPLSLPKESSPRGRQRFSLAFRTPLRLIADKALSCDFAFSRLMHNLNERLLLLAHFHCGADWPADAHWFVPGAERVTLERLDLLLADWPRYSSTQGRRLDFSGWVGRLVYRGELEKFLPLLALGEHLHLGKHTSFGCGKYELGFEDE